MKYRWLLTALPLVACGDNLRGSQIGPDGADGGSTVSLGTPAAPATESGDITVTVSRTGDLTQPASVTVSTADATAVAGQDYVAANAVVTWAANEGGDRSLTFPITDDLAIEGAEQVTVELSAATGATIGNGRVTAEITDDDRLGDALLLTSENRVVTFDRAAPATATSAITITGLNGTEELLGIDIRPSNGQLYSLSNEGRLYTIDPSTGVATLASTLAADAADTTTPFTALVGTTFGIDFNPVPDRLRVVSETGQNLRINVDTGATITDGTINGTVTGATGVGYTNSFALTCRTQLFALDAAGDRLVLQSPPNDGTTAAIGVGLGLDATNVYGFDVSTSATGDNAALAALEVGGAAGLYTIDLGSGAATAVGALALEAGETARGLAVLTLDPASAVPQAPGELYVLDESNQLRSINRGAPGKACSSVAFTGLDAADVVVGLDFRPSTGALVALTNATGTGKLYTIDPATGAAAPPITLSVPLVGTDFGVDFNPTGPVALRIVSDTGQNLRVTDVATGATTADTNLNGAGTGATAAGYTDSLPGAGSTTLYVLDTATDRLRLQSPPNAGTLVDVGPLGADLTSLSALDIDGRDNVAFVAANVEGGTATTLHTLDLTSGAVSASLGAIAGGARIRGLTRTPPTTTVFGLTTTNTLVKLSLTDPSAVTPVGPITGLGGENLIGIDVRPSTGLLHGVGDNGGVFAIDPETAAATKLATLAAEPTDLTAPFTGLTNLEYGLDFNPTGPVALRIVGENEQNLRVANPLNGRVVTDANLNRAPRSYAISAVAYTNNVGAPQPTATTLYGLDATTDRLVTIVSANSGVVREIGPLGIDVDGRTSLEIVEAGTALAVAHPTSTPTLYTVDLATGAATAVGAVGVGAGITLAAIAAPVSAMPPAANSPVFAATSANTLVRFNRDAPGAVTPIGALAVGPGETIVGLDVRPSTGELWLLTREGVVARLYTVNEATGATTQRAVLGADLADVTSPYLGLAGNTFAMDFNPTGPVALRIISDLGQNLRIVDPTDATTQTFTDTPIAAPVSPDVVAAAYTNSYAGATATSLLVIDAANSSLMTQSPPNDGVLTPVGALSPSLQVAGSNGIAGIAAFDIAGGNNGVALAALQRVNGAAAEAFSRLYRVNVRTGTATELGAGIGGAPLRGLAIQVR